MKINDDRVIKRGNRYFVKSGQNSLNEYVESKCLNCGEICLTIKYRQAKKPLFYCTNACRGQYERGEKSHNFRGGKRKTIDGYIEVLNPDLNYRTRSNGKRYVKEHSLVMERHLGRPLLPNETVHHKNGVRDDNRIENLELFTGRHGRGQRVADLVEYAKEILAKYGHL